MFTFQDRVKWVQDNAEYLASDGTTAGIILEKIAAAKPGRQYVDGKGLDYVCEQYRRVEVKSTVKRQGSALRIQHYQGKRGRFDHIHVIDGISGRNFMIPHDVFFSYVGNAEEFHWSVSYNTEDNARQANTNFIQTYEVTTKSA